MTGLYAGMMMLGRHLYTKKKKEWIGIAYPFISAVLLIVALVPTAILLVKPVYSDNNTFKFWYELIALIFNFACAIVLMAKYWKKMSPVNLKKDGIVIFAIPAVLHLYDIIVGFGLGIKQSYIPVVVFTVIHMAYLFIIYRRSRKAVAK